MLRIEITPQFQRLQNVLHEVDRLTVNHDEIMFGNGQQNIIMLSVLLAEKQQNLLFFRIQILIHGFIPPYIIKKCDNRSAAPKNADFDCRETNSTERGSPANHCIRKPAFLHYPLMLIFARQNKSIPQKNTFILFLLNLFRNAIILCIFVFINRKFIK